MVTIELAPEEKDMLADILTSYLSDLRMEIADTDLKDYRDGLKLKEEFIKKVLSKLD
jgi:hypothetical protein